MQGRIELRQSKNHPFDLSKVLDGTQDFRWRQLDNKWYSGVLKGNIVHVRQSDGALEYRAHTNLDSILTSYFRLDENIDAIFKSLSEIDPHIASLAKQFPNLRVLRQPDPWECTVAYICSANNSIQGIARIVEKISFALGNVMELEGNVRYTFPTPEQILNAGTEFLQTIGLGLKRRPRYIFQAAQRVCEGQLDLQRLTHLDTHYTEAKRQLMQSSGIGPKTSDCIALFSLNKRTAFPVDRHIRKAIIEQYRIPAVMDAYPTSSTRSTANRDKKLINWAQNCFGENAGWAGQLLFRSRRPSSTTNARR